MNALMAVATKLMALFTTLALTTVMALLTGTSVSTDEGNTAANTPAG